ncbi:helix-turn-helix domain-containing protein [Bacillus velezensis]|nr:helix-turn-helix transcriptional regulator [Bacillus velezensis]QPV72662.1 helix-turn-helix transcriptional regulator [Bacillus velezensis]QWQ47373.1 helix-turn-helix domain-containing protein [Bacillus velezensis]
MKKMNFSKFRSKIKSIRGEQTVREFASHLGFSPSFISKIENGKVNPSLNSIERISKKLDIPMSDFF